MNDRTIGRAGFLGILGLGAAGLFLAKDATGLLDRAVPKSVSSIVPTSGWRIYTVGSSIPTFDPVTYRLDVTGLVGSPTSYTLADLKAMPRADQISDFHCVTGWSVSDVRWGGVRIADLLERAGAQSNVAGLNFVSAESPYEDSLTLEQALLPDVMLAYEMDGGPISRPHGAPVRLVMPQMYGYKSVKWVNRIELGTTALPGYWEQNGYDADAWLGNSNGFSS
ncbi:MAG: molybdopterin-dependent oxidoreductase [Thermoleophilia bacterium]|nr:molybdopterin-dependent oxidoreductase [Thermoleophilia bacterium]